MVDGEGTLRVTLDVSSAISDDPLETGTVPSFNLTTIEMFGGAEDCNLGDNSAVREVSDAGLRSCTQVTANYRVPGNLSNLEAPGITIANDSSFFDDDLNTLSFGSESERRAFFNNFVGTSVEVVKFGVNFLPFFSDGADLLGQLYNRATGQQIDPVIAVLASAGLIFDTTTGGIGDVTAAVKGFYKLSLNSGTGRLAGVIATTVQNSIQAGKNASDLISDLKALFGTTVSIIRDCGFSCLRDVDEILDDLIAQTGESVVDTFAQFKTSLTDATSNSVSAQCFIGFAADAGGTFALPALLAKLFGIPEANQTPVQTQQLEAPASRCGYAAFRTRIASRSDLYEGISSDELKALAPHHIVPRGAKADRFCIRSTDPTNVCDGARQILEDANISLEDPNNGVLLAWNHHRNKDPNTYAAFDAKHPNALAHDGTVHNPEVNGAVFDRLEAIREQFPDNINDLTPAQREQLQRDVQQALQRIQLEILNGTFPQTN